jgi:drug/metabolite transporter (DMT)-like permease
MSTKQAWGGFWLLSLIWGSSFLFIRIGVEEMTPMQLVFFRTGIAAIGLHIVLFFQAKRMPRDRQGMIDLLILGTINTILPFVLISWGEIHIESGLASVLQATAAFFTLLIAHFVFADERITWRKVLGLLVGFLGIVVLASRSLEGSGHISDGNMYLLGQAAVIGASMCYAVGGVYSRKAMQRKLDPFVVAAGSMTVAAVLAGTLAYAAPLVGAAAPAALGSLSFRTIAAVGTLGLLNTFAAYLIFYPLIQVLGSTRASMVTYVVPVMGLILGSLFLSEVLDLRLVLGTAMILGGIAIVNLRFGSLLPHLRKRFAPKAVQDA